MKAKVSLIQNPLEDQESYWLAEWLDYLVLQKRIVIYSHVPHETYIKGYLQKIRNWKKGVRSGVPDYFIITPKKLIVIELKRRKGGTVSKEQWIWLKGLREAGIVAEVAKGFTEAKEIVEKNL
jgi:Uma2 family endonuclease